MLEAIKLINPYAVALLVVFIPIFVTLIRDMARLTALVDKAAERYAALEQKVVDDHEPRIRSTEITAALTRQRLDLCDEQSHQRRRRPQSNQGADS